ncbi:BglG family transcription antiterminator [Bacillus suaedae]|uniref:BglG family transcription antiterminator n=1 Tax=Halalkalibacter suaedae TaxID=2822140 RepID=A0A941ANM8_9BACI|nr:BglG family transcription antiterminator [Bacillus suaedae]MBP3950981.1 BglG family transcription antiterminator [Bacillus suaedae]
MYISARERTILEVLLRKEDETTVKELAKELNVSSRTVHRDLKGVEDILHDVGLALNKKSGSGIKIIGEENLKELLKKRLFQENHNEYTPDERLTIILTSLLEAKDPIKLVSLATDLNVTIATISNDLNKVEEKISAFELSLIRKRGYGLEINGSETAKRKAMSKLLLDHLDEFELITLVKENIIKKSTDPIEATSDRLLGLVDKQKLFIIEKHVNEIKGDLPYSMADSAYIGLLVHLTLAIERIQQGENVTFNEEYLESLKHTREFTVAKKLVEALEKAFQTSISLGEVGYITMHLMGAKLRNDYDHLLEDTSLQVGIIAQKLIQFVSKRINYNLSNNSSLFQGLVAHLRPALYRIKQKMGISNPLLYQIEQDYHELFLTIEAAVQETLPELIIPKEEIGYLVMHFASALLNQGDLREQHALVVCSSGIGTSKMLSTKLQQEIPSLKTSNVSLFDLETMDEDEYDLIVSTIPLGGLTKEYILVNPLLSELEINQIKRALLGKKQFAKSIKQPTMKRVDFLTELNRVQHYIAALQQVISGFSLTTLQQEKKEEMLIEICERLLAKNVITNSEQVVKELLEREEVGGLGIPGTMLALYHTRSDAVQVPSFTVYRLHFPLSIKAMDNSQMKINTILMMLCPQETTEETLELLSGISSIIIRDEKTTDSFQTNDEKQLELFFTSELRSMYNQLFIK